jgi:hypothetical protein
VIGDPWQTVRGEGGRLFLAGVEFLDGFLQGIDAANEHEEVALSQLCVSAGDKDFPPTSQAHDEGVSGEANVPEELAVEVGILQPHFSHFDSIGGVGENVEDGREVEGALEGEGRGELRLDDPHTKIDHFLGGTGISHLGNELGNAEHLHTQAAGGQVDVVVGADGDENLRLFGAGAP